MSTAKPKGKSRGSEPPIELLKAALQGKGLSPAELAVIKREDVRESESPTQLSTIDISTLAKIAGIAILIGAAGLLQRYVPTDIIVSRDVAASIDVVTTLVNAPLVDINHASLREVTTALHKALLAGLVIGGGFQVFSNISRRAARRAEASELRREIARAIDEGQLSISMQPGYTAVIMAGTEGGGNSWATDLGESIGYRLIWGKNSLPLVRDAASENPTSSAYWINLPGFGAEKTDGEYSRALQRAKIEHAGAAVIVPKGGSRPFLPNTAVDERFAHHFTEVQDHIDAIDKYLEKNGRPLRPIVVVDDGDAYLAIKGQLSSEPTCKTLHEKIAERNQKRPSEARIMIVDPSEEALKHIYETYRPKIVDFVTIKGDAKDHGDRLRHKISQTNQRAGSPLVGFELAHEGTSTKAVDLTIGATGVDPAAIGVMATDRELVTVNTITILLPDGRHELVAIDELVAAKVQAILSAGTEK